MKTISNFLYVVLTQCIAIALWVIEPIILLLIRLNMNAQERDYLHSLASERVKDRIDKYGAFNIFLSNILIGVFSIYLAFAVWYLFQCIYL